MLGAVIMQYVINRIISCSFSRAVDGSRNGGFPRRDRNFFQWFGPDVYVFGFFLLLTISWIWLLYIWSSWWGGVGVAVFWFCKICVVLGFRFSGFRIAWRAAVSPDSSSSCANMRSVMGGGGCGCFGGVGWCVLELMFFLGGNALQFRFQVLSWNLVLGFPTYPLNFIAGWWIGDY